MIDFARKNNKFRAESMKFSSIPPDFSSKLGGFDDFLLDSAQIFNGLLYCSDVIGIMRSLWKQSRLILLLFDIFKSFVVTVWSR